MHSSTNSNSMTTTNNTKQPLKPKLIILYGTETGTAEELAERVAREACTFGLTPTLKSMDSYLIDWKKLIELRTDTPAAALEDLTYYCFICSTTGQGDLPKNMQQFWKALLRKNLPCTYLSGVSFTVYGLGDSSYAKYNYVAKKLHKRLIQLGATPLTDLYLGDDQHELGPDATIPIWINKFWLKLFPDTVVDDNGQVVLRNIGLQPKYFVHQDTGSPLRGEIPKPVEVLEAETENGSCAFEIGWLTLVDKKRVTAEDHFQDVELFTFELAAGGGSNNSRPSFSDGSLDWLAPCVEPSSSSSGSEGHDVGSNNESKDIESSSIPDDSTEFKLTYSPGDVLNILPTNLDENVDLFYELFPHLKARCTEKFYIVPNDSLPWAQLPYTFWRLYPQPWTMDFIVRHYFDLQASPKKQVFELLEAFTTSEIEKGKLHEFLTPEGQQELYSYAYRPKRTVLEVIQDFPHTTDYITEDYLFDLFKPIKPRSFSIASAEAACNNTKDDDGQGQGKSQQQVQILVAVIEYKTKLKKPRLGLCSNFLKRLTIGENVPAWITKGSFKFPATNDDRPMILIGPGTGCAPFRSLINARHGLINPLILFFGCRFAAKDFYFKDEWLQFQAKGELELYVAFSRDSADGSKVYVQDLIEKEGKKLYDLIMNQNAMIFIAGNAKQMPNCVREAFINVIKKYGGGGVGIQGPAEFVDKLVKSNRYQTEVWS